MTIIAREELENFVNDIWTAVISLETQPCLNEDKLDKSPTYSACVYITGTWNGGIVIQTTQNHAKALASAIFGSEPDKVEVSEMRDVVGELTNMLSGNIKATLPEPCKLSLPTVVDGNYAQINATENEILMSVTLEVNQEPIRIVIFKKI